MLDRISAMVVGLLRRRAFPPFSQAPIFYITVAGILLCAIHWHFEDHYV